MKHFDIQPEDLPYLHVQCGDIAGLINCHPASVWLDEYNKRIETVYQSMLPHLPKTCSSILDVGGGFSGIGCRLVEHYRGGTVAPALTVLDGVCTPPEVVRHNQPFNDAAKAVEFHRRNGVFASRYIDPVAGLDSYPVDLVISTQAWGFHIAPHVYLPSIVRALKRPATLIIDVRNRHDDWNADLRNAFGPGAPIYGAEKWTRRCFRVE